MNTLCITSNLVQKDILLTTNKCRRQLKYGKRLNQSQQNSYRFKVLSLLKLGSGVGIIDRDGYQQVRKQVTQRIQKLGAQGKPREALNELLGMARKGVQPDTQAATALLSVCVQNGKLQMAENIFDQLFGEYVAPDPITFSVLIQGYGSIDPPDWEAIASTLRTMETDYELMPDVTVYNALLNVCVRSNDLQRAQALLAQMERERVTPDEITRSILSNKRAFRACLRKYL
eukprot:TRINITY_DN5147_c0_g1_i1.p2 TRINITY_DN5147_c0_g1~~TRINITY_DN5147_c0_g1_i1.p2  ORF type:complete len:230 (-),score=15.03 TRINITY_DN5147_c0_g1_i1:395-1084(-)